MNGSSMVGLISLYAMCEYPKGVFAGAGCPPLDPLASHRGGVMVEITSNAVCLPPDTTSVLRLRDRTPAALYSPIRKEVDQEMEAKLHQGDGLADPHGLRGPSIASARAITGAPSFRRFS